MTRHLLFVVLLLPCIPAQTRAQRSFAWEPDTTLRIGVAAPFDRVTIEDIRRDKTSIGSVKPRMNARPSRFVTNDSVAQSFGAYADLLLHGSQTEPGELLVVLRDFRVENYDGLDEIAAVHIRADLFRSAGVGAEYMHLRSFDTLCETKNRWNETDGAQSLASQAVLTMITVAAITPPSGTALRTRASAVAREDEVKNTFPLYASTTPPRGIYGSLDDFLYLRTTDTVFLDTKVLSPDAPPIWYFHRRAVNGKKGESIKPKDCFAIYDGKQWHLSSSTGFKRLQNEGGDFYFSSVLDGLVIDRSMWLSINGIPVARIASGDRGPQPVFYRVRLDPEKARFVPVRRGG